MKLTLDVENTVTHRDGKMHLDPFEPTNSLVMVGMLTDQGQCLTFPFDHAARPNQEDYYERVQMMLDEATILICHNAPHDLVWLWESVFKYDALCLTQCWQSMLCSVDRKSLCLLMHVRNAMN